MARDTDDALDDLILAVREDPEYKKYKLVLKAEAGKLKLERDRNEAMALMAARTSRSIHGKKQFSPKVMLEAASNDMAARTRIVEIRIKAKLHVDLVEAAVKAIKAHVTTEYGDQMRQFSNAESRGAFLDRVAGTGRKLMVEGNALIEMLDQIVNDIDKASYHMTTLKDMIVLLDQSRGSKVI